MKVNELKKELEQELSGLNTEIEKTNTVSIESLTVNNDLELKNANEICKQIRKIIKNISDQYKPYKTAFNEMHKMCISMEKAEKKPYEEKEKIFKNAIGEYMLALEEKRQEEIEMAKEAEDFGLEIAVSEKPKLGGTHIREVWDVEITDPDAVPIKYGKMVIRDINIQKLKDIAKYEEGKADIPGVKFIKKKVTVIR